MKGIRELAEHLDISIGTVSRALNNKPDVSEATRKRVLDAAIELGYVPNQSGRSLRQGTTNAVGFMLEAGTPGALGGDNFFTGLTVGVQNVLRAHGLDLVLLPCSLDEDPHDFLQRIVARRFVDSMIISATRVVDSRIELLKKSGLPFVTLGRSRSSTDHAWIDMDFEGVARDAVARLAAQGHTRIALAVSKSDANLADIFLESYREALAAHGIVPDEALIYRTEPSDSGGSAVGEAIIAAGSQRPTAIILVHELMAIGLYRVLQDAGLSPGRDIAVVGFRNSPQVRFLRPTLSCYTLSLQDLGAALAEGLLTEMFPLRSSGMARMNTIWPMNFQAGDSGQQEP